MLYILFYTKLMFFLGCFMICFGPIPWVPGARIENSQALGPPAAPPRFQTAPAPPAAARRQGSSRPFGPRAAKCVTTHHDAFPARASRRAAPRPRAPCVFSVPPPSRPPAPRAARSPRRASPVAPCAPWGRAGAGGGAARKTCVSCGPHTISRPRPVTRPQASLAPRADPIKIAPNRGERPKP